MTVKDGTVLSIAVASGKIGYVFLIGGELCKWGVATKASKSTFKARAKVKSWLDYFDPDVVVLEQLTNQTRKSGQTVKNIKAIHDHVESTDKELRLVERVNDHDNKYDEIAELANTYPTASAWIVPPRKLWEAEHKNTVIWEALSLVDQIS